MSRYAAGTDVPADRSRAEIERTLERYGADAFGYAREARQAMIQFRIGGRFVRIMLPLPDPDATEFKMTPTGKWERSESEARRAWEQACRQRWRALALVVKAKLEAVAAGISTIEREFLSDVVLPDGSTVGNFMQPQVERAYLTGDMPKLLPEGST